MCLKTKHYLNVGNFKCHWNFWLLPKRFRAITLFGHIFFNTSKEEMEEYLNSPRGKVTLNHERIHTLQAETFKTKYLGFYIYYLAYWIRNLFVYGIKDITAYENIPFEREAVDKSLDFNYSKSNWFNYRDRILKNKEGN